MVKSKTIISLTMVIKSNIRKDKTENTDSNVNLWAVTNIINCGWHIMVASQKQHIIMAICGHGGLKNRDVGGARRGLGVLSPCPCRSPRGLHDS